jgi:hypothetical protein
MGDGTVRRCQGRSLAANITTHFRDLLLLIGDDIPGQLAKLLVVAVSDLGLRQGEGGVGDRLFLRFRTLDGSALNAACHVTSSRSNNETESVPGHSDPARPPSPSPAPVQGSHFRSILAATAPWPRITMDCNQALPDAGSTCKKSQRWPLPSPVRSMAWLVYRPPAYTANLRITGRSLSMSDGYLGTIEPSTIIVLGSLQSEEGAPAIILTVGDHLDMKPFWFRAAKVTDVGAPVRLGVIAAVMVGVAGAFAGVGGWLSPDRLTQDRLMAAFQDVAAIPDSSGASRGGCSPTGSALCFLVEGSPNKRPGRANRASGSTEPGGERSRHKLDLGP